jgi:hypothetical protein
MLISLDLKKLYTIQPDFPIDFKRPVQFVYTALNIKSAILVQQLYK